MGADLSAAARRRTSSTGRRSGSVFQTPPSGRRAATGRRRSPRIGGRFFVYYTARKKRRAAVRRGGDGRQSRGAVHRSRADGVPGGGLDRCGGDPRREGPRYLVWKEDGNSRKQPTPLWAQPLSDDGTKLIGEPREILRNEAPWEAHLIEGPFILRRDDWFYLFYSADACCGRRCNYKLGVARRARCSGRGSVIRRIRFSRRTTPGNAPATAASSPTRPESHVPALSRLRPDRFRVRRPTGTARRGDVGLAGLAGDQRRARSIRARPGVREAAIRPEAAAIEDDFTDLTIAPDWQWPWDQAEPPTVDPSPVDGCGLATHQSASTLPLHRRTAHVRRELHRDRDGRDRPSLATGARAGVAAFGNRDNMLGSSTDRAAREACGDRPGADDHRLAGAKGAIDNTRDRAHGVRATCVPAAQGIEPHAFRLRRQPRRENVGRPWLRRPRAATYRPGISPPRRDARLRTARATARFGRFAIVNGP